MSASAMRFLQQENIRLKKELEDSEQEKQQLYRYFDTIQSLHWASQNITSEQNLLYALNKVLFEVMNVIGAKDASVSRLDEAADELVFVLAHGDLSQQLPGFRIKSNTGIAGWVVENQKPIIVNNPRQDWRFSQVVDSEFGFFTRCIISVPIAKEGKFYGVIQMLNKPGNKFNEADVALLLVLGRIAAAVLEEMPLQEKSS